MFEKIIIDGIDVSGCAYYYRGDCRCQLDGIDLKAGKPITELFCWDTGIHTNCENLQNCYYKQLQTLKTENKIIMERLTAYEEDADVQIALFSDVDKLQVEKEKLEIENSSLKNRLIDIVNQLIKLIEAQENEHN